ncbi:SusC/RagA family TonB-linked outer membrane protein [Aestuariibaculum marinum]|uniref:SusC/RagA family TonB-linked outer membrane protein n=1 Tax=Aestuariibaculum marinum TaxID=2683592 RepID=A0A8J6PWG2_9FLAO|nr:SusC/RagA family TonB-linked outer membrane protein [Aestuariibaculum marinum]MBD0824960.1 SusC/RagA family TonB-linked outer membrane protein [Aestuariibaculum marinum]
MLRKSLTAINFSQYKFSLKLTCLFVLLNWSLAHADTIEIQKTKITLNAENELISKVIDKIESISDYRFIYNVKNVDLSRKVSIHVSDQEIEEVLKTLFRDTHTNFKIRGTHIVLNDKEVEESQDVPAIKQKIITVKGVVEDEHKQPLPGATVMVKGTKKGVVSNFDGEYVIQSPKGETLLFSYIGYETKEVVAETESIDVQLFPNVEELNEVVVTGIFNRAKESYTGAATFINKKQLEEFESRDILKTISNIDPAFNITISNEFGSDPNRLPDINIRGMSSVPNKSQQELDQLQDDERANLNTPLFILDGFEITLQRMLDLNQDEIESVTILKDASATAIYGAQGANGVVVLTSVKPKAGKLRVNYRSNFNVEVPDLRSYDLLNASEKLELERLAGLYDSDDFNQQILLKKSYNTKLKAVEEGVDTYWLSRPVQTGLGQTHNLSLGGGDPAFRYSMNFQFRKITGAMKGSNRENFNGSVNITYLLDKIQFTNILSIGFNQSENSQYGSFSEYANLNPYWRPFDEDGLIPIQYGEGDPAINTIFNPLYNASLGGYDKRKYTNIRENFQLEWSVNDNFKIRGVLGYTKNIGNSDKFLPPNHTSFYGVQNNDSKGTYGLRINESSNLSAQTTINYAKVFNEKHKVFIGVNGTMRETQSINYGINVSGFAHDRMDFISMGSKYVGDSPSGREATTRSLGITSNANYSYDNIYYADLSYRLDGASSFGENSRFAPFYSIGLGANLSKLAFVKEKLPVISNLRPKYSYGVTGSLQFSPYDAMTTYTYLTNDDRYDGNLATAIRGLGNPDLKWQTTYQHNVGFEIGLWNNTLALNSNYYYKKTEDLITSVTLPLSNGYTTYTENLGDVLNQGIEADLSANIIRNNSKGWTWSVRGGISHNRNKLLKLSEAMKLISEANEQYNIGKSEPNVLYREGESMNALYVVPSLGIDPATGREMFVNADGEVTYNYPQYNRVAYGLTQPKINGRLSTNVSYRNLRVNLGFSFRTGASIYNSTLASRVETTDFTKNVDQRVYSGRWRQPGDVVPYKSLVTSDPTLLTSRFVQNEKTLSLNTLNIDYRVPSKWVKKHLKMDRVNISYATNDLLYFSTIKLERGTGYPFAWRHSLSLSFGF